MKKSLSAVAILSAMVQITAPADAADSKTFPGSMCHPDGETFANFNSGGGLFNPSISAQYFSCPVVRDTSGARTDGILSARVHVADRHASLSISCTLSSRHKTSATAIPSTVEFATLASTGVGQQQLDFLALDSGLRGYYVFTCSIPPVTSDGVSGIYYYEVVEND